MTTAITLPQANETTDTLVNVRRLDQATLRHDYTTPSDDGLTSTTRYTILAGDPSNEGTLTVRAKHRPTGLDSYGATDYTISLRVTGTLTEGEDSTDEIFKASLAFTTPGRGFSDTDSISALLENLFSLSFAAVDGSNDSDATVLVSLGFLGTDLYSS